MDMETTGSYEELKQRNKDLEILTKIIQAIHKSSDLEEIYRVALDLVIDLENVDMTMIYLVDKEKREAVLQAHRNLPEDYIRRASRIPHPKGVTWKVINTGRILNVEDVQKDPDVGPAGRDLGHHSVLGIPITLEERVIGVIWFVSYKERRFNEREVSLLSTLGDEIAIAISKAKLYRELSRKNRYETIISTVTQSVHRSINLQDVLENAVEAMSKNIDGVENVSIYLVEGKEAILKAHRGYPDWWIKRVGRISYPKGFTWKTITEGKPRYVADVDKDTAIGPAGREMGTKSYMSMPIGYAGKAVGVININSLKKSAFDEEELKLMETIAQQIEIAINNAQKAEVLQESEERYRNLVETAPEVIFSLSAEDGAIISLNPAFEKITGWSRAEWLGSSFMGIIYPNDLPIAIEGFQQALRGETPSPFELRFLSKSGEYLVGEVIGTPQIKNGKVVKVFGFVRDITERKRTEEALRESEAKNRALLNAIPDLMVRISKDGTFLVLKVTKDGDLMVSPSELLGKNVYEVLPTEVAEQFMHYVERALQIGDIQIFEYQLLVGGNMRDHEARMIVSGEDEVLVIVRDITGRRRAEVVLRESEEHFRSLIENALDIITILNGDGTIRYESPSIERVLGYKPEDLIGKNVFEFIQPDDALNVINTFTHGIQNPGVATSAELRFQHKDGSWRILEAIGTSFLDDSGVTGIVVNSRDITERKRAEEALRESEERFRTLFENIPTGVYRTTPDGRILNANPALIKMLGYASFEELALRNLEKEGFESRYSRRKFRERIERDGEIRGMEAVWRRKDNSVIFVRENAKAIRDANDATLYYEGTVEDITERKRAEEALQSSEERYRTLYENNPLMVFTVDKEGTVLSVNQFGVEQLGYTVEELVGQSVLNVFYEDEKKAVLRHLTACLHDSTQVFRGEFRKVRKDGRVLWVKEVARAMQDTNGNTVVLIVCEDITEQIEIQKKLIQKEKLASLGEMAAGVAHEIRNPLGGIKMAAGLIRRDLGEKSFTTDMLNNILSGIKDIENIINDLLDFTRETKLEKEDYNIARMIKGVVNSLHREISEKGIQIVYNRFQGDIDLNVDGIKIRQVFINVLKNAIEAINHEEGKILINLYSHDSYVSIEFIDNGVGISKENLEKMYHPFFTTKPKGTGLGMTIVKRIVDLHKGDMDIKSVSGEGTKVKIILPVGGIFDEKKHSNS